MPTPQRDKLLPRGVWLLVVGVFTSWLLGLGLLFILAAAVCGFVGLFRSQPLRSALLLLSSMVLGFFCFQIAAVASIYAFNKLHSPAPAQAEHLP